MIKIFFVLQSLLLILMIFIDRILDGECFSWLSNYPSNANKKIIWKRNEESYWIRTIIQVSI